MGTDEDAAAEDGVVRLGEAAQEIVACAKEYELPALPQRFSRQRLQLPRYPAEHFLDQSNPLFQHTVMAETPPLNACNVPL